jgi:hypothetical protein
MPCITIFLRHSCISSAVKKLHLLQRSQVCRRYVSPPPSAAAALLWNLSDLPHRFHDAFTTTESDDTDNATRLTMGTRYVPRTRLNPPIDCNSPTSLSSSNDPPLLPHLFSAYCRTEQNPESRLSISKISQKISILFPITTHESTQSLTPLSFSLSLARTRAHNLFLSLFLFLFVSLSLSLACARARRPVPEIFFEASLHYSQSGDDPQED